MSPPIPIMVSIGEKVCKASFSVKPLILQTIQKPLSFIHGINFDPQAMESPMYRGWNSNIEESDIPANIPEAVIIATVADPWAVRTTAVIKKARGIKAI